MYFNYSRNSERLGFIYLVYIGDLSIMIVNDCLLTTLEMHNIIVLFFRILYITLELYI